MKTGSPSRKFALPPISSLLLGKGLKLYAVPLPDLPLVGIHLIVP